MSTAAQHTWIYLLPGAGHDALSVAKRWRAAPSAARTSQAHEPCGYVVRCFGEGDGAQHVSKALERPAPPGRGQMLAFADTTTTVYVDRVIHHPTEVGAWRPGFAAPGVSVQMAPEPADGLPAALASGWKVVQGSNPWHPPRGP